MHCNGIRYLNNSLDKIILLKNLLIVCSSSGKMVVSWLSLAFSETLHLSRHIAHVCLFITVVLLFEVGAGGLWGDPPTSASYPPLVTLLFQLLRLLPLLALPQVLFLTF